MLGILPKVGDIEKRLSARHRNALSVRVELLADCFAGVWAALEKKRNKSIQSGDIEQALAALSSLADDRLQKETQGVVVPEDFAHGTSQQRVRWYRVGAESGQIQSCDTFNAKDL